MRKPGGELHKTNHGGADYGLARVEQLRAGPSSARIPFVIGSREAQRFMITGADNDENRHPSLQSKVLKP
jgi:hypothetical protein